MNSAFCDQKKNCFYIFQRNKYEDLEHYKTSRINFLKIGATLLQLTSVHYIWSFNPLLILGMHSQKWGYLVTRTQKTDFFFSRLQLQRNFFGLLIMYRLDIASKGNINCEIFDLYLKYATEIIDAIKTKMFLRS